jgi:hypothetical protein
LILKKSLNSWEFCVKKEFEQLQLQLGFFNEDISLNSYKWQNFLAVTPTIELTHCIW